MSTAPSNPGDPTPSEADERTKAIYLRRAVADWRDRLAESMLGPDKGWIGEPEIVRKLTLMLDDQYWDYPAAKSLQPQGEEQ